MTQSDENFLVYEEDVDHDIYPARADQLKRNVILKGDFDVNGGIYSNNLRVDGKVHVHGPVIAKQEIELVPPEQDIDRPMMFTQGITAVRSITVTVNDLNPYSPASTPGYTPLVIKGDVCSPEVHLENAVLVGNVRAERALIKDCLIFGSPIVAQDLQMENSLALSFQAGSVQFRGRNSLMVPHGLSRSPITPDKFERIQHVAESDDEDADSGMDASDDRAWVRYLGLCSLPEHGCGERILPCERHYNGTCPFPDVRISPDDVLLTKDKAGNHVWMLTMAHRIINLKKVEDELRRLKSFTKIVLTMDHMDNRTRRDILDEAKALLHPEENRALERLQELSLPDGTS
ncbi:MAG: hypothetical protein QF898_18705 [SAR202 cluster bacterium]|jgi:hypothetical protein|nr:hypothetical protein [SAR202 cluster bacterium]MDP6513041.1 hypothetical protein [SAR202 cluster bacterium]MDP6713875.1 hypothetical protein [SAR202 cluster bacterium]